MLLVLLVSLTQQCLLAYFLTGNSFSEMPVADGLSAGDGL